MKTASECFNKWKIIEKGSTLKKTRHIWKTRYAWKMWHALIPFYLKLISSDQTCRIDTWSLKISRNLLW